MVFVVRFKEIVNLRAINLVSSENRPDYIGIYFNQENVNFDIIEEQPIFSNKNLHYTQKGEIEFYPNPVKSKNLHNLVIHLKNSQKSLKINFLGIKGFSTK